MRKLRNKLLLSILTVALTFIALGTTTFAWFTLGGTVTAEAFTANVKSAEGIEISLDGTEWSNTISLTATDVEFKDITSTNGIAFLGFDGQAAAAGTYASISFKVRTTDKSKAIYTEKLVGIESNPVAWVADATFSTVTKGDSVNFDAINAVRVAFVVGDTAKVIEIASTNNFGTTDDGKAQAYADAKGLDTTNAPAADDCATPDAYVVAADGVLKTAATDGQNTQLEIIAANTTEASTIESGATTYYVYDVTLNVWLEGWDADCINAILGQSVTVGFELKSDFQ